MGIDYDAEAAAGLTPAMWRTRLEQAASDPDALAQQLRELKREIRNEHSFLESIPSPDGLLERVLSFFQDKEDHDYQRLGRRIEEELRHEKQVVKRYRGWKPGEDWEDRLFLYLKDFAGEVKPDPDGVQFPGFDKFAGHNIGRFTRESYVLFLNQRFPGREPANFHVMFRERTGELVIKRVYKKELPRYEGRSSAARAVLAEMIKGIVPDLSRIREFDIDNAANRETRQVLLAADSQDAALAQLEQTPLGYLMKQLALELGLTPGAFRYHLMPFDMIRIELGMKENTISTRKATRVSWIREK
jgi:hypothetical protein